MMTTVEKSAVMDVPVDLAYEQWARFEDFPRFMDGVERVTRLDDDRVEWVAQVGGVRRHWVTRFVEQRPEHRLAWTAVEGTGGSGEVTFADLGSGQTEARLRLEFEPHSWGEQVGDAVMMLDSQAEYALENFQLFIEGYLQAIGRGSSSDGGAMRRPRVESGLGGAERVDQDNQTSEHESDDWLDGVGTTIVADESGGEA